MVLPSGRCRTVSGISTGDLDSLVAPDAAWILVLVLITIDWHVDQNKCAVCIYIHIYARP